MLLYGLYAVISLVCIYFLTKGNTSPYKNIVPAPFAPLTHLEIKQKKPFIWVLCPEGLKPKWIYEASLLKTKNLSIFWQNKDAVLSSMENKKMKFSLEYVVIYITKMLWEVGKKPKGIIKRYQFKKFFFKYCFDNIEATVKIFNDFLDYQSRVFFLLQTVQRKLITQQEEYSAINGDLSFPEVTHGPKYTSNTFLTLNIPKKTDNSKKKTNLKQKKSTKESR